MRVLSAELCVQSCEKAKAWKKSRKETTAYRKDMNRLISERKCFSQGDNVKPKAFLTLLSPLMNMIAHVSHDLALLCLRSCARSSAHRSNSEKPTMFTASVHVMH